MRHISIDGDARRAVYARSQCVCERCHKNPAVHVHHLTYARAGRELPEDLQHVCISCHCEAHPTKYDEILKWELCRIARIASSIGEVELETDEESAWMAQRERDREDELEKEYEQQQYEQKQVEPAWNLGGYHASGYDIEAIENEESRER